MDCEVNYNTYEIVNPSVILSVIGLILVLYTAFAPNIETNRRVFGIVFTILWVMLFSLVAWGIWKNDKSTAWFLIFVPLLYLILFFIVVVLNVVS